MWGLSEIAGAEKHIAESDRRHHSGAGREDSGQWSDRFQRGRVDTSRFLIDCAGYNDFSATIGENISMFKPCRAERIRQAIEKAGLTTWFRRNGEDVNQEIEKSKANLSGGEMRRMDFARTILQEKSQIFLFDEPTAGLDAYNAQNIMEQICNMKQGMRIVATHNLAEENMRRFDWIYMMEQGEIILEGKPEVILQAPAYQKLKQEKQ